MTVIDHAAQAGYGALAPYYDAYTEHPGYIDWVRALVSLAREHGAGAGRALDVGCGTGKSLVPLLEEGFACVGVDAVPGMLAVARERLGPATPLHAADMARLPGFGAFELAFCINDALNCLLTPTAVEDALRGIAANLRPGGILVFDASTPVAYRDHFAVQVTKEARGMTFHWDGRYDGERAVASLDVLDGDRRLASSTHVQQHHPDEVLEQALASAGLETLARYGQHDDGRRSSTVEADHFKVIHVVKRTVHPLS